MILKKRNQNLTIIKFLEATNPRYPRLCNVLLLCTNIIAVWFFSPGIFIANANTFTWVSDYGRAKSKVREKEGAPAAYKNYGDVEVKYNFGKLI